MDCLTLKISHVCPHIRVQRVDDHLAVCWAGDLDAPVHQTRSRWCASPCVVLANVLGLWEEVEQIALVEFCLSDHTTLEESFPALVECAVEESKEDGSIFAQDVSVLVIELAEDVNLAENGIGIRGHDEVYDMCVAMQLPECSRYEGRGMQ